jgi:hypothetical protein
VKGLKEEAAIFPGKKSRRSHNKAYYLLIKHTAEPLGEAKKCNCGPNQKALLELLRLLKRGRVLT